MTLFRLPGICGLVGTWWLGRGRAGAPLLATDVALRARVEKYIERSELHVLMRFQVIVKTLDSTVALIVDSSV